MTQTHSAPAAADPAVATLGTFGVVLGVASTVTAMFIGAYFAIALAVIGLPLSFIAKSRAAGASGLATTAVVFNILGLALAVMALMMKAFVMSRGG